MNNRGDTSWIHEHDVEKSFLNALSTEFESTEQQARLQMKQGFEKLGLLFRNSDMIDNVSDLQYSHGICDMLKALL